MRGHGRGPLMRGRCRVAGEADAGAAHSESAGDLPAGWRGGDAVGGEGHGRVAVEIEEPRLAEVLVPARVAGVDDAEVEGAGDRPRPAVLVHVHGALGERDVPGDGPAEAAHPAGRGAVRGLDGPAAD